MLIPPTPRERQSATPAADETPAASGEPQLITIPAGTQKADAAEKFVSWATSKHYAELVASKEGWANVPPGTRSSLYANAEYQKAAPFAKMTLDSINAADPTHPTVKPDPTPAVQPPAPTPTDHQGGAKPSPKPKQGGGNGPTN